MVWFDRLYMWNDGVMGMDWVWIGKGLIYRVKLAFLKLLGKLRELWEMNEIGWEGNWGMGMVWVVWKGLVNWGVFGKWMGMWWDEWWSVVGVSWGWEWGVDDDWFVGNI